MITLEQIKESLRKNPNLTDAIKGNLFELTSIFHSNYPQVDLTNLDNRLKTINIDSGSKYVYNEVANYNPTTNQIYLNVEELNKDNDMKHVMMCQLLQVITAKDNAVGFNRNNKFSALNIGYTEIIANNLVGNESDKDYHTDEVIATDLIANMVGLDVIEQSYFNNNSSLLTESLTKIGLNPKVNEMMNYNMVYGTNSKKSKLPEIILEISKTSIQNGTWNSMQEKFDINIPSAECFENPNRYSDLKYFKQFTNYVTNVMNSEIIQEEANYGNKMK